MFDGRHSASGDIFKFKDVKPDIILAYVVLFFSLCRLFFCFSFSPYNLYSFTIQGILTISMQRQGEEMQRGQLCEIIAVYCDGSPMIHE